MNFLKTRLKIKSHIKDVNPPMGACLIYDKALTNISGVQNFISRFESSVALKAGESLKSLKEFEAVAKKVIQFKAEAKGHFQVWSLGGGSIGDFSGFVASVVHRGVPWINIPSTWLSAVDSAHGGKTALNLGAKNQIGTFFWPEQVYLVRSLLMSQPENLIKEAWAEAFKVSLLTSSSLSQKTIKAKNPNDFWRLLPDWIRAKNRVVNQDPFEKRGKRIALNLGHTLGHVLEIRMGLSHGEAVLNGLRFALEWSNHLGLLSKKDYQKYTQIPQLPDDQRYGFLINRASRDQKKFLELLRLDKKNHLKGLRFIYLKKPGAPVVRYITKESLYIEARRQADLFSIT